MSLGGEVPLFAATVPTAKACRAMYIPNWLPLLEACYLRVCRCPRDKEGMHNTLIRGVFSESRGIDNQDNGSLRAFPPLWVGVLKTL